MLDGSLCVILPSDYVNNIGLYIKITLLIYKGYKNDVNVCLIHSLTDVSIITYP